MDLYVDKDRSIPQKATIIVLELLLLWLSYWILFQNGGFRILHRLRIENISASIERRQIIFAFSIVVSANRIHDDLSSKEKNSVG